MTIENKYKTEEIKKLEKLLSKNGLESHNTYLFDLIRSLRKQTKLNLIFTELLSEDIINYEKYGTFSWVADSYYWQCVMIEEPDTTPEVYLKLKELALRDYSSLRDEFELIQSKIISKELGKKELEQAQVFEQKFDIIDKKHASVKEGFLYALSNPSIPNLLKIGFTTQSPTHRAAQLSSTSGIPTPFEIKKYFRIKDPYIIEQMIHSDLQDYRIAKEFFAISVEQMIHLVNGKYSEYIILD
jgi:hypothetical protein